MTKKWFLFSRQVFPFHKANWELVRQLRDEEVAIKDHVLAIFNSTTIMTAYEYELMEMYDR